MVDDDSMAQAASDSERTETWLETLASAAARFGAGEALAELRNEARELLSEVRRAAAEAAGDAATEPAEPRPNEDETAAAASISEAVAERLDVLSSSLEEVADLLDAGLERLETVEMQLGDPDDSVDARLRSGIESCERRLGGLEQGLRELARSQRGEPRRSPAVVLVVDADWRRRCDLCVALEHQGFYTLAAGDAGAVSRMLRSHAPNAVLACSDVPAPLLDALAGELAADSPAARLVLAPWPATSASLAELAARLPDWTPVTEAHGIAALAATIQDVLIPKIPAAEAPALEQ